MKHPVAAWTSTTSRTTRSSSSQPGSPTRAQGRSAARRDDPGDGDARGQAVGANRPPPWPRRQRRHLLHEPHIAQGRRTRRESVRRCGRPLVGARAPGTDRGCRRADVRRGVARVLADAPARQPARRLVVASVAPTERSRRARGARRGDGGAIRRERRPAAAVLGRLPPRPTTIEFWTHRDDRLHDRVRYVREGAVWRRERLAP